MFTLYGYNFILQLYLSQNKYNILLDITIKLHKYTGCFFLSIFYAFLDILFHSTLLFLKDNPMANQPFFVKTHYVLNSNCITRWMNLRTDLT